MLRGGDPLAIVWQFIVTSTIVFCASIPALGGIARSTPEMVTRVAVGALVGLALTPVATAIERRWELTRERAAALVGLGLALGVAAVLFLVGPPAVRQLQDFGDEVPETIEELYSWPIIGGPLREADAAAEAEQWIEELPSRIDDQTIADLAERLLGGLVTAGIVVVTALGVLFDGPSAVRRIRAAIPSARRDDADRTARIVYRTFGSYFAPLVAAAADGFAITRGEPAFWRSSNVTRRGFCAECGTPLFFWNDGAPAPEVALGTLDDPSRIPPQIQVGVSSRAAFVKALMDLPERPSGPGTPEEANYAGIVCFSYPLHPPGKPEQAQPRSSHWPRIRCPVLILQGEADPFARMELLRAAMPLLPDGELHTYPRVGHSLKSVLDDALDRAAEFLAKLG